MEPLLYVIAVMGCADVGTACGDARIAPAAYRTEAACRAAQDEAILAAADIDYPVIVAECRQTGFRYAADAGRVAAGR